MSKKIILDNIHTNLEIKTIQEKAVKHVESVFSNFAELTQRPWPEFKDALIELFLAGATGALTSQWQSPDSLAACKERKVITRYRTKYEGSLLTLTSIESPEDWACDIFHKGDDLIVWMPIPELPQNR